MSLRPYQSETLAAIDAACKRGVNRQLVVLPTASGKMVIIAHAPEVLPLNPWETMFFLCHRDELVLQAVEKFRKYNPSLVIEVEKAEQRADPNADIIVASVQSLRGKRLEKFDPRMVRAVFTDEAHHAVSRSYLAIYEYLGLLPGRPNYRPDAIHLGFTATPGRADAVGLEAVYQEIPYHRSVREMIDDGWLANLACYRVETQTDISDVRVRQGDFVVSDLEQKINTPARNRLIVAKYEQFGHGLPALAFTVDIAHSEDLATAFREAGWNAHALSTNTPLDLRRQLVSAYKSGEVDVLCSCGILTEGSDLPRATVGLMARPTKSNLLFCQQVGRLLRPFPAPEDRTGKELYTKDHAIILDFADLTGAHDLIALPSLFGLPPRFNTKGKKVTEVLEEVEQLQMKYPALRAHDYTSVEEMRAAVTSVDLFRPPEVPKLARKNGAKLAWLEEAEGVYRIALPDRTVLRIHIDTLGHYEVHRNVKGAAERLRVFATPREAFTFAESLVDEQAKRPLYRDADWRKKPPKEGQCQLLWGKDATVRGQFKSWREFFAFAQQRHGGGDPSFSRGGISRRLDAVLAQSSNVGHG